MNFQKLKYTGLIILFLLLLSQPAVAQCSMCRAVLESEVDQSAAKGINDGILYLMIFPYILIGGIGYFIYRSYRNRKRSS